MERKEKDGRPVITFRVGFQGEVFPAFQSAEKTKGKAVPIFRNEKGSRGSPFGRSLEKRVRGITQKKGEGFDTLSGKDKGVEKGDRIFGPVAGVGKRGSPLCD